MNTLDYHPVVLGVSRKYPAVNDDLMAARCRDDLHRVARSDALVLRRACRYSDNLRSAGLHPMLRGKAQA